MILIEKAAEQSKNNIFYNTLDGVSSYVQQPVCNSPVPMSDQHETNAENCTKLSYHAHFKDILTEYPAWSTDANDIENNRGCRPYKGQYNGIKPYRGSQKRGRGQQTNYRGQYQSNSGQFNRSCGSYNNNYYGNY